MFALMQVLWQNKHVMMRSMKLRKLLVQMDVHKGDVWEFHMLQYVLIVMGAKIIMLLESQERMLWFLIPASIIMFLERAIVKMMKLNMKIATVRIAVHKVLVYSSG